MDDCCAACFLDPFLAGFVQANGSLASDPCAFCGAVGTPQIDATELGRHVLPVVIGLYCNASDLTQSGVVDAFDSGESLADLLQGDFDPFSSQTNPQRLIEAILADHSYNVRDGDGYSFGDLWARSSSDWTHRTLDDHVSYLEDAVNRLGHSLDPNGTFPVGSDVDVSAAHADVMQLLQSCAHHIRAGETFWRARVGRHAMAEDLTAPPPALIQSARANLSGERVLYVADSAETAIAEVRPSLAEEVTVAAFRATRDMQVCRLIREHSPPSPFESLAVWEIWRSRQDVKVLLGDKFGVPIRRSDTPREYLFTQYISRMIRAGGLAGIQYVSSQSSASGTSVVLFDPFSFEPVGAVRHFTVRSINYVTS